MEMNGLIWTFQGYKGCSQDDGPGDLCEAVEVEWVTDRMYNFLNDNATLYDTKKLTEKELTKFIFFPSFYEHKDTLVSVSYFPPSIFNSYANLHVAAFGKKNEAELEGEFMQLLRDAKSNIYTLQFKKGIPKKEIYNQTESFEDIIQNYTSFIEAKEKKVNLEKFI